MATYTQLIYHIVFSTKNRVPCLLKEKREQLYYYIWGLIKKNKSHLYRINGVEDHLHILTSIHPTLCISDFVKNIKTITTLWIKKNKIFPDFMCWQEGYGAFTHSIKDKAMLIEYIKKQADHHKLTSFRDELRALLVEAGISIDKRYASSKKTVGEFRLGKIPKGMIQGDFQRLKRLIAIRFFHGQFRFVV